MKLEPPVPVPVDSIFSWGCADDDLIDSSRFNSCDAADSTTGGAEGLAGALAGNSAGMLGLSCAQTKGNSNSLLTMDGLDGLLLQSATNASLNNPTIPGPGPGGGHSFAELKPLPPFDYSTISSLESALSNGTNSQGSCSNNNNNQSGTRTILDINLNLYKASPAPNNGLFYSEPVSTTSVNGLVSVVPVLGDNGSGSSIRNDGMTDYLMNQDIDIAAIIGNAIADSTVAAASNRPVSDPTEATGEIRDAWADFDAWIESACASVYRNDPMLESPGSSVTSGSSHSSLSSVSPAFLQPPLPPMNPLQQQSGPSQTSLNNSCSVSSTLQALLTQGPNNGASGGPVGMTHLSDHLGGPNLGQNILVKAEPSLDMPLLQRRLTAGRDPPDGLGSSGSSGPNHYSSCSMSGSHKDLQQQLPHTTFHSGHVSTSLPHLGNNNGCHSSSFQTARRSMVKKELNDLDDPLGVGVAVPGAMGGSGKSKHKSRTGKVKMSTIMTTQGDKEKPVHRCNICNRGFLNKSNIKVHLRTHTGEKPFKCDHCAKAFRQKAHLLKHMQIHKRVSRD